MTLVAAEVIDRLPEATVRSLMRALAYQYTPGQLHRLASLVGVPLDELRSWQSSASNIPASDIAKIRDYFARHLTTEYFDGWRVCELRPSVVHCDGPVAVPDTREHLLARLTSQSAEPEDSAIVYLMSSVPFREARREQLYFVGHGPNGNSAWDHVNQLMREDQRPINQYLRFLACDLSSLCGGDVVSRGARRDKSSDSRPLPVEWYIAVVWKGLPLAHATTVAALLVHHLTLMGKQLYDDDCRANNWPLTQYLLNESAGDLSLLPPWALQEEDLRLLAQRTFKATMSRLRADT